jgi:hypothetical protein
VVAGAREERAWRRSAVKAGACDVEGVGGRRGGWRVCVCVYAVDVSCFRVEYGPGCSVWRGVGGRWGGVDVDVIERVEGGVEFSSGWLALHLLLSLLQASLSPRTLLLAETGLDQHEASNLAHARMNEAKLCRDCFV